MVVFSNAFNNNLLISSTIHIIIQRPKQCFMFLLFILYTHIFTSFYLLITILFLKNVTHAVIRYKNIIRIINRVQWFISQKFILLFVVCSFIHESRLINIYDYNDDDDDETYLYKILVSL